MSAFLGYSAVENSGEEALFLEAWVCRELLRAIFFLWLVEVAIAV